MTTVIFKGVQAAELRVMAWRNDPRVSVYQFAKAVDMLKREVRKDTKARIARKKS